MMVVADLIRSTTVIQRLFLFGARCGMENIPQTKFLLPDNDITDIGCEIICDAMSQNTSIRLLSLVFVMLANCFIFD